MFRTSMVYGASILAALDIFSAVFESSCRFCWVYEQKVESKAGKPKAKPVEKEPAEEPRRILYFTASWCEACQMQKPTFKAMRGAGRPWKIGPGKDSHVQVIDYDRQVGLVRKHRVEVLPTWVLIEDGKALARTTGTMSSHDILAFWNSK